MARTIPAFGATTAVVAGALSLVWLVRRIVVSLAVMLGLAAGLAWYITEAKYLWGAQIAVPWVAQASISAFAAMTLILFLGLLLLVGSSLLLRFKFRLALLGWARNRYLSG
jgi:hypothetical protein